MKVSLLMGAISRKSGGLFNSVRMLALAMNKLSGLSIDIVGYADDYTETDIHQYLPIIPEMYKIIGPKNVGFSTNLGRVLEDIQPDILHPQCIWMHQSFHSLKYHQRHGTPIIITPRGMMDEWTLKNSYWKKKIAGILYENDHLKSSSCFHALARSEAESIRATGISQPIVIIPNGINIPEGVGTDIELPEWYDNLSEEAKGRKKMLFLGRIHPKKGLDNLLGAWKRYKTINKDWILVVAGWGDTAYINKLKKLVEQYRIQNEVYFIGSQFDKQKEASFRNSDAFILPSFSEGLPMAVLEAWSYKLPVIMTDFCNIPLGFEEGAAIKVEPQVDSIYNCLSELSTMTSGELLKMGNNGHLLVQKKFTWEKIAKDTQQVYNWLKGGGATPTEVEIL